MALNSNQESLDKDACQRAFKSLEEYSFMKWLDPYIRDYKSAKTDTAPNVGGAFHNDSHDVDNEMDDSFIADTHLIYTDSVSLENGVPSMANVHPVIDTNEILESPEHDHLEMENNISEPLFERLDTQSINNHALHLNAPTPPKRKRTQIQQHQKTRQHTTNTSVGHSSETSRRCDEIFGEMIAAELSKFPDSMKFKMKHDINNIVYKYNMEWYGDDR